MRIIFVINLVGFRGHFGTNFGPRLCVNSQYVWIWEGMTKEFE